MAEKLIENNWKIKKINYFIWWTCLIRDLYTKKNALWRFRTKSKIAVKQYRSVDKIGKEGG